jgi:hypothetical protein
MTKENIFKSFLEDDILFEKNYLSKEKAEGMKFIDQSGIKLIEVIKLAITGSIDQESDGVITRKINLFLNK